MKQYQCNEERREDHSCYFTKHNVGEDQLVGTLSDWYYGHYFRWHTRYQWNILEFKQLQCLLFGPGLGTDELTKDNIIQGNKI